MCEECGCGQPGPTRIDGKPAEQVSSPLVGGGTTGGPHEDPPHVHVHEHDDHVHVHDHEHDHDHGHDHTHRTIELHQSVFAANDRLAERNRGFFRALNLLTVNMLSSPGSGKTSFIKSTIEKLGTDRRIGVIVGDLETDNDARRLRVTKAPVVQITTGTLCHLDAAMIARALGNMDPRSLDILIVENVGNLVCPSSFDLGEDLRVALLSVTEGEDKPLKYPPLFRFADIIVVTKIDLARAAEFDREAALDNISRINPHARIFEVSSKTGEGIDAWCDYLREFRRRDT